MDLGERLADPRVDLPVFSAARQLLVPGPFPGWARVSDSEKPQVCFLENISPAVKQALDGHPLLKALPPHGGERGPDMTCWGSDPSVKGSG